MTSVICYQYIYFCRTCRPGADDFVSGLENDLLFFVSTEKSQQKLCGFLAPATVLLLGK